MTLPTILTGAAGRALHTLQPVSATANLVDNVLAGPGKLGAGELGTAFKGVGSLFGKDGLRETINRAGVDVTKSLGASRGPAFSAELHAATQNMYGSMSFISRGSAFDDITRLSAKTHTAANQVSAGIAELESIARSTATRRVVLGAVGVLAGAAALTRASTSDGPGKILAPGPLGGGAAGSSGGSI